MKLVIEIENYKEEKRAHKFISYLKAKSIDVRTRQRKIKRFLNFTENNSVEVETILIGNREERNAR